MTENTYIMFGTDVVSCVYADQWNRSDQVDGPIIGFVDDALDARIQLETFRPEAALFSWASLANRSSTNTPATIVYPKHHERLLMEQLQPLPSSLRTKLNAIALPEPPDYVIEWQPFDGSFAQAAKLTEGYDSSLPTKHLVETTLQLTTTPPSTLTSAQERQVVLIETLIRHHGRPIRVVDFGGAAGANYYVLPDIVKSQIKSWTVIETPEVVRQVKHMFGSDSFVQFETTIGRIQEKPDYVLASSSLQYVPNVESYLDKLLALEAGFFCIDRTPVTSQTDSQIYIQRVHRQDGPYSYQTSYPLECRPLEIYLQSMAPKYEVLQCDTLGDEKLVVKSRTEPYVFVLGQRKHSDAEANNKL